MKTLSFFPSDLPLPPRLDQWFRKADYKPVPFDPENSTEPELLLFLTPVECAGQWLSIEKVWNHYFMKRKPDAKFIQTGILGEASSPNYLHLYHLPSDFKAFLKTCRPIGQEDWEPVQTGLVDLEERLHFFFDGHGNNGFWFWLTETRRFLNFIPLDEPDFTAEQVRNLLRDPVKQAQVETLKSRWKHYKAVFSCLPDQSFLPEIEHWLNNLDFGKIAVTDDSNLFAEIREARRVVNLIKKTLTPWRDSLP